MLTVLVMLFGLLEANVVKINKCVNVSGALFCDPHTRLKAQLGLGTTVFSECTTTSVNNFPLLTMTTRSDNEVWVTSSAVVSPNEASCTDECRNDTSATNSSSGRGCSGDLAYRLMHPTGYKASGTFLCSCRSTNFTQHAEAFHDSTWTPYEWADVEEEITTTDVDPLEDNPEPDYLSWTEFGEGKKKKRFEAISTKWEQPYLTVYALSYEGMFVILTRSGESQTAACSNTSCLVEVHPDLLKAGDELNVRIYRDLNLIEALSLKVTDSTICSIPHCFFCDEYWANFNCYPASLESVSVVAVIGVILLCLMGVTLLVGVIYYLYKRWQLMQKVRLSPVMVLLLFCCCASAAPVGCTNAFSSFQQVPVCYLSGGIRTCNVTLDSEVILRWVGDKACYSVTDSAGAYMGSITLRFVESRVAVSMTLGYWTSNWELLTTSQKYCRYLLFSGSEDYCSGIQDCSTAPDTATMGGAISGTSVNWPGESICTDACGCAGCSCVNCDAACLYARWALRSTPSEWARMVPTGYETHDVVEVCWLDESDTEHCGEVVVTAADISTGPFTLTKLGDLGTNIPTFEGMDFMDCGPGCGKFAFTARPGFPSAGEPGDIQASSLSDLQAGLSTIMDETICHMTPASSGMNFYCSVPGITELNTYSFMPTTIGTLTCHPSNIGLSCVEASPVPVVVRLESNQNISLTRLVSEICPVAEFISLVGCFDCDAGAIARIKIRSDCLSGTVVVVSTEVLLATTSLSINVTDSILPVKFFTAEQHLSFNMVFQGTNGHSATVRIAGSLLTAEGHEFHQDKLFNTTGGSSDNFADWLDGLDWGSRLGVILGIIFGSLIILIVGGLILYLIYTYSQSSGMFNKMRINSDEDALL